MDAPVKATKSNVTWLAITTIVMSAVAVCLAIVYSKDEKLLSQIKKDNSGTVIRPEFAQKWAAIKASTV